MSALKRKLLLLRLRDYEAAVENKDFVVSGLALAQIRNSRLYRLEYRTFDAYLTSRWDCSRMRACQRIRGAFIADQVNTALRSRGCTNLIKSERLARSLYRIPAEQRVSVWLQRQSAPVIYFVRVAGQSLVKIGFAENVGERIGTLQTASPFELVLLGTIAAKSRKEEAALHKRFASDRVRGEWFYLSPTIRRYIFQYAE